jgi:hypothetical protein
VPPEKRTGAAEAQERQRRRAAQQQAAAAAGPFGALFGAAAAAGHPSLARPSGSLGAAPQQQPHHRTPGLPAPSERVGDLLLTHEKGEAEAVRRLADELLGGGGEAAATATTTGATTTSPSKAWITAPRASPPCAPEREAAVACYSAALGDRNEDEDDSSTRLLACAPVVDAYARCASAAFERQQAAQERARGQKALKAMAAAVRG